MGNRTLLGDCLMNTKHRGIIVIPAVQLEATGASQVEWQAIGQGPMSGHAHTFARTGPHLHGLDGPRPLRSQ